MNNATPRRNHAKIVARDSASRLPATPLSFYPWSCLVHRDQGRQRCHRHDHRRHDTGLRISGTASYDKNAPESDDRRRAKKIEDLRPGLW